MLSYKFQNEDVEVNYDDTFEEESNRLSNYLKFEEEDEDY